MVTIGVLLLFVNAYINIKIYIYFMLDKVFYYVGGFGPLILLFSSLFLLWNKHNLFFYYSIGIFVNAILNDEPTVVSEIDGYLAMEVAHQILDKIKKSTSVLRQAEEEAPKPPKEDGSEYALNFDEED